MNERAPESTGLPLRAMVMVLLFLGVVFLLVGLQSWRSDSQAAPSTALSVVTTTAAPTTSAAPARPVVTVLNGTQTAGLAQDTADRLREDGWTVDKVADAPPLPEVTATTVFYTDEAQLEQATQVSRFLLTVPPELRPEPLAAEPPGLVVVVTG